MKGGGRWTGLYKSQAGHNLRFSFFFFGDVVMNGERWLWVLLAGKWAGTMEWGCIDLGKEESLSKSPQRSLLEHPPDSSSQGKIKGWGVDAHTTRSCFAFFSFGLHVETVCISQ